jgi:hypothetical protein
VHPGDAAGEGFGRGRGPLHKSGFWPARRFGSLEELDDVYERWRDRVALPRRHATGRFIVAERLEVERDALRALPPVDFDAAGRRSSRVPLDGYLKHAGSFYRAPETLVHQRVELRWDRDRCGSSIAARWSRATHGATCPDAGSRRRGCGLNRPARDRSFRSTAPAVVPPALSDYAVLCA